MTNKSFELRHNNINTVLICNKLLSGGAYTKKELAVSCGLSIATCSNLLADLAKSGKIMQLEPAASNGGRRALRFCVSPDYCHILCIYLDNNSTRHCICYRIYDFTGKEISEGTKIINNTLGAGNIKSLISEIIFNNCNIHQIVIGVPCIVDENSNTGKCEYYPAISHLNLKEIIESEFGINTIAGNDLAFASRGFYHLDKHKKPFSLSVGYWPENELGGAGSVIDGHVVIGSTHFAGEISFLPSFSMEQQKMMVRSSSKNQLIPLIGSYITSANVLLNPDKIYITGNAVDGISLHSLQSWCESYIPSEYLSEIILQPDMSEEYFTGLFLAGQDEVSFI
jgi:hypothetical protein